MIKNYVLPKLFPRRVRLRPALMVTSMLFPITLNDNMLTDISSIESNFSTEVIMYHI